ncbi:pilus assembly protein FimV [Glaciimonas sp. CA11.2]|uniref:PhaM family polyhydroxyalkanoate granule multifunctional regulatory protein n=1 Tax=unclassified Glaciimonas TaxID=2644401 RepID=UPI002AB514F1|nr:MULTISPECIES: PhaM family polyhydroxyalkanoate granule multifunctional regulatory protein [unclassified Glaciimonas]MDY7546422.1 pilus assembly protein FimV [Glaciimonas sp. CA11.2]MEB0014092.1 pilus assembly protein FimV [Glaciimonas sp. Cout2]MEB0083424.1 pilus assembly protein FimV [Glaciimonas sp. Gout2]MEB0162559.1 pilus assembly protein FimV [Glaciimonas sp. CA11.2]
MSNPNFLGADAMSNSVDFIKKMWGGMGVPGMVVPIISVEEIDKKVTDLKAVEGWLSLNLNMLRTTIQALEVQSATLTALKSIGALMPSADGKATAQFTDTSAAESVTEGAAAWATMASQFPFSFMPEKAKAANETVPQQAAAPIAEPPAPAQPEDVATENHSTSASDASPAANTGVWWDVLQNQFKQVVSGVMAAEAAMPKEPKASTKARKSAAKPGETAKSNPTKVKPKVKPGAASRATKSTTATARTKLKVGTAKASPVSRSKKIELK